ncbi:MAG: DUF2203 domain-containing protein [Thermoguttaceae bacterium]
MRRTAEQPVRLFTVEQANAALPLVRAIVGDLVRLARDVWERRQRLDWLGTERVERPNDPYYEELLQMEEDLDRDSRQLQEYVGELRQLGVEPKSAMEGLVDFPAVRDGRRVYLCWKLGEPEVLFWHELEAGYRGRQPLAAGPEGPAGGQRPSSG